MITENVYITFTDNNDEHKVLLPRVVDLLKLLEHCEYISADLYIARHSTKCELVTTFLHWACSILLQKHEKEVG